MSVKLRTDFDAPGLVGLWLLGWLIERPLLFYAAVLCSIFYSDARVIDLLKA